MKNLPFKNNNKKGFDTMKKSETKININEKEVTNMKYELEDNIKNIYSKKPIDEMVDIGYGFDMRPLYRLLLAKCGEDLPTLIVVDEIPELYKRKDYIFVKPESDNSKTIIVMAESDGLNMKLTLLKAITSYQNQNSEDFKDAFKSNVPMGSLGFLSHNKEMYYHALKICNELKIPCPQIIMNCFPDSAQGETEAISSYRGVYIGSIVRIKKAGRSMQLVALAHELKHCWQQEVKSNKNFFTQDVNQLNHTEYCFNQTEIEAVAYSCKYIQSIKHYADIDSFLPMSKSNPEYTRYFNLVMKYMKSLDNAA